MGLLHNVGGGGFSYRIFNRLMEVVGRIGDLGVKSGVIGANGGV